MTEWEIWTTNQVSILVSGRCVEFMTIVVNLMSQKKGKMMVSEEVCTNMSPVWSAKTGAIEVAFLKQVYDLNYMNLNLSKKPNSSFRLFKYNQDRTKKKYYICKGWNFLTADLIICIFRAQRFGNKLSVGNEKGNVISCVFLLFFFRQFYKMPCFIFHFPY